MAFDKLVDSAALEANLKTVADAIREKAGTSDALAFPAGFAEAIAGISAGGGYTIERGSITFAEDDNTIPGEVVLKDNFLPTIFLIYSPSPLSSEDVTNARTLGASIVLLQDIQEAANTNRTVAGVTAATYAYSSSNVMMPDIEDSVFIDLNNSIRLYNYPYTLPLQGVTYEYVMVHGIPVPAIE